MDENKTQTIGVNNQQKNIRICTDFGQTNSDIDMKKESVNQFGCDLQTDCNNLDVNDDNCLLKLELDQLRLKNKDLERKLNSCEKELDEFKRINLIQENCIENSESEILRLNECLKSTEILLQNTVDVSEKIITDLKSKLKSDNNSTIENPLTTSDGSTVETKVQKQPKQNKQKSKPYFYVTLNQNSIANKLNANLKSKLELKVLENQMNSDLSQLVLKLIRQMAQSVDTIGQLAEIMAKKLNKTYGKHWNCVIGENISQNSVINYSNDNYIKCELNSMLQLIVYKNNKEFQTNSPPNESSFYNDSETNHIVSILKKSTNIEGQVEKFIINTALDGVNQNFQSYKKLSEYLRDSICNKYNSQWFVSVGQNKQYSTSWAMARSRKFLLFEIGDIKFTCGEVAGLLW